MYYGMGCNIWRADIDEKNLDFYDFLTFEKVITSEKDIRTFLLGHSQMYQNLHTFLEYLCNWICDYCYGRQINLKNVERWKRNFLGDINLYLFENIRYLQSYLRDVNNNIDKTGTKTDRQGATLEGRTGSVSDSNSSGVGGGNTQVTNKNEGNTLTILNNQTTSTAYLASRNDESYSTGSVSNQTSSNFDKSNSNNVSLSQSNTNSLQINTSEGTYSKLDIANLESNYKYSDWIDRLKDILDSYFLGGDVENYA